MTNLVDKPLVCPYPRKYFAFLNDGINDICCGVFPSLYDSARWSLCLTDDDLFINGIQYGFSQIQYTSVCRLG